MRPKVVEYRAVKQYLLLVIDQVFLLIRIGDGLEIDVMTVEGTKKIAIRVRARGEKIASKPEDELGNVLGRKWTAEIVRVHVRPLLFVNCRS